MCGIIGIIGNGNSVPHLIDGLKRLEYRGYDSAGIATLVNGEIERRRAEGKIARLEAVLDEKPLSGDVGIGHTRWATHGVPSEENAHPHVTGRVAVVHNGIIENYRELRESLGSDVNYQSDTDTEVVAHLIERELSAGRSPEEAVSAVLPRLEGAFALVLIFAGEHDLMIGARRGSPLAIGLGEGEMYIGSDALALANLTDRLCYLEEGDWAVLHRNDFEIFAEGGGRIKRDVVESKASGALTGKDNFSHYMLKEIHEQPSVIGDTLHAMLNPAQGTLSLPPLDMDLAKISRITACGCGTAYYACLIAKYWIERLAGIGVETDIGSELRYRAPPVSEDGLALFVSQSGETMDTLESLRMLKRAGQRILSVVNVPQSTIARESDAVLLTKAGPEIGVASTKAFTTQLAVLAGFSVALARARGAIDDAEEARLAEALSEVPRLASEVLQGESGIEAIAHRVARARDVFYLGRGISYPIALEGALKLKEISYIHAEGYAAGEMKHGPIALIEDDVPVIVIAPSGPLLAKTAANVQEIVARGGTVILISDEPGIRAVKRETTPAAVIEVPEVDPLVAPILYAIPVQLLAYHTAVLKGTDVDQPRNLAKSVTVE